MARVLFFIFLVFFCC
ncbi:MAG: hypothetical protein ACM3MB_02885 [Acidobacteriota bacterium]